MRATKGVAIVGVVLCAAAGVAYVAWSPGRTSAPGSAAIDSLPEPTAEVEVRMVEATVGINATVVGKTVGVASVTPGVGTVVTRVLVSRAELVDEGNVLGHVAERPIIVLQGDLPTYRSMRRGDRGEDIVQLQEALDRLGFSPGPLDGIFGPKTEDAITAFYESLGETPLGPTAEEADAVWLGRQDLEAARSSLASSERQVADAIADGLDTADLLIAVESARVDYARSARILERLTSTTGVLIPLGEVAFVRELPARIMQVDATVGADAPVHFVQLEQGTTELSATASDGIEVDVIGKTARFVYEGIAFESDASEIRLTPLGSEGGAPDNPEPTGRRIVFPLQGDIDVSLGAVVPGRLVLTQSSPISLVVPASALLSDGDGVPFVRVIDANGVAHPVAVEVVVVGDDGVAVAPLRPSSRLVGGARVGLYSP